MNKLNPIIVLACPKLSTYAEQCPAIRNSLLRFDTCSSKDRAYELGFVRGHLAARLNGSQSDLDYANALYDELRLLSTFADRAVEAEASA
jgi:hypothetical protein